MRRLIDIIFSIVIILLLTIPFLIIFLIIFFIDGLPIIYWSKRIGKDNHIFLMPKFRTMKKNTPQLATHLLDNSKQYLLPFASFFRKTSIDELPQIFSILIGSMSFIGPRPALYNQIDLKELRTKLNIHTLKPGLTGYAQTNGRDNLSIEKKVELDYYYYLNRNLFLDLQIIFRTFIIIFYKNNVKH